VTREAFAVGLWRNRLALTRNRCLYVAESSLSAAERLQHIRRECQQKDARIYCRRAQDALLAVASIDEMTETQPRRAVPDASPRRAYLEAAPRRASQGVTSQPPR
jgi:hypothetical protein